MDNTDRWVPQNLSNISNNRSERLKEFEKSEYDIAFEIFGLCLLIVLFILVFLPYIKGKIKMKLNKNKKDDNTSKEIPNEDLTVYSVDSITSDT